MQSRIIKDYGVGHLSEVFLGLSPVFWPDPGLGSRQFKVFYTF